MMTKFPYNQSRGNLISDYVLDILLQHGPCPTREIYPLFQRLHPGLCGYEPCWCDNDQYKWHHEIGNAMQKLRINNRIKFNWQHLARLCLRPKAPRRVIASVAKQSQPGKPRPIVSSFLLLRNRVLREDESSR